MTMRCLRSLAITAAVLFGFCGTAHTDDYPAHSIRVIVGLAPGGGGDAFARTLSEELRKAWNVPVVVENRPGGGETIGARACAGSAPDGYTVCLLSNEATTYHRFLFKDNPFDSEEELQPVAGMFINTFGLAVTGSLKLKTLDELVARSKANSGTFSYGTFSFPLTRFMEKLRRDTGADIVQVSFRGGGELVNAMLSGSTQVGLLGLSNMLSQVQAGLLTLLAVNNKARSPLFPDVPTFIELGRGDYPPAWFGLFAPNGTPKAIIHIIGEEVSQIVSRPEFRTKMFASRGIEPLDLKYDELAKFLHDDIRSAQQLINEAGYQPQ
jgi:tripartite-type tricarboxylate transporter receptor subunit TctC